MIRDAALTVYYLFEIAEGIDLGALPGLVTGPTTLARLVPKPATPAYIAYREPPIVIDEEALGPAEIAGFKVRAKVFGYGVVSLAMSRPFKGEWGDLLALGQSIPSDENLERQARACVLRLIERVHPALNQPRANLLVEDYVVFAVHALDVPMTAEALLGAHGDDIAHLLRGERSGLSGQERDEVLRHRLSYLADDLVIPTWNTAFVYDTHAGAQAALEIFEFANSQLLEFRYYDALLDSELGRIYDDLQEPRWYDVLGRRRTRAANHVYALFIDVNELTDKMENALKLVGDIYAARLYTLAASRLGLDRWKANVEEKLETLDDVYRFSVDQLQVARGHLLELVVVIILLVELVFFFLGLMR